MPLFNFKLRDKSRVLARGEDYDPEKTALELSRNSRPALHLLKRLFRGKGRKDEIAVVKGTILGAFYDCRVALHASLRRPLALLFLFC